MQDESWLTSTHNAEVFTEAGVSNGKLPEHALAEAWGLCAQLAQELEWNQTSSFLGLQWLHLSSMWFYLFIFVRSSLKSWTEILQARTSRIASRSSLMQLLMMRRKFMKSTFEEVSLCVVAPCQHDLPMFVSHTYDMCAFAHTY